MQLDLFIDSPRHYYEAERRLRVLDLDGCRAALREHRRFFAAGDADAQLEQALNWLEAFLPPAHLDAADFGCRTLALCRALRDGPAPVPALAEPSGNSDAVVQSLARGALARMQAEHVNAADPLGEGLPWGVFYLLAGEPIPARQALIGFLQKHGVTAAAYIALGDACAQQERSADALGAYREGLGLDPEAQSWQPEWTRVTALREQYRADPLFPGSWWVVGAYLDGALPRYVRAPPHAVARRWERFQTLGQALPPVRFFAGLFLSEHGHVLAAGQLAAVRRTLRDLHPEGFASHLEQVSAEPLREPSGREAVRVW